MDDKEVMEEGLVWIATRRTVLLYLPYLLYLLYRHPSASFTSEYRIPKCDSL